MISEDSKAGILVTVIIHLAVIIVLLSCALGAATGSNNTVYIELPEPEERVLTPEELEEFKALEAEKAALEEAMMREQIRAEVLSGKIPRSTIVNRDRLADDRNTDVDQLEKDRQRAEEAMKNALDGDFKPYEYTPSDPGPKADNQPQSYSGPGMIEYDIPGWRANYLYPPGWTQYTGGVVTVQVTLDSSGNVSKVSVISSTNSKLNSAACSAARQSSFTGGTPPGEGWIRYTFASQR